MVIGKSEFYQKAKEALTAHGYQYFDGDKDIHGKGIHHASKPDYIAVKGNTIIIGEIKSPAESPKSGSWRQIQKNDSEEFKKVRLEVLKREKEGKVTPEVGGHEIIIRGQIPDYFKKLWDTYDLPFPAPRTESIVAGYTFPAREEYNVGQALTNCNIDNYKKIDTGNGAVTFIFDNPDSISSPEIDTDSKAPSLAYYCIIKKFKGLFKKKFDKNIHLFFFPIPDDKYIYLIIKGQLLDEEDSYVCTLVVEIESHLLQPLINGEKEKLGKQFLIVEVLSCQTAPTPGGYILHVYKKGKYIKSDLGLQYLADSPSYLLKGKLNLETEDRIL